MGPCRCWTICKAAAERLCRPCRQAESIGGVAVTVWCASLDPNNATDVWSVKKVNPNAMIHLTEKPVELAMRAIQYSSRAGENVLNLFGGSGSARGRSSV